MSLVPVIVERSIRSVVLNKMKAHQRIIREQKSKEKPLLLFSDQPDEVDIKQATIRSVSYETAKKIILEYEWLGTMGTTQRHFGIYFDGHCGGVVCYGYFQAMEGYRKFVGEEFAEMGIQLSRGACFHWAHEHSASKLISGSLAILRREGYKYAVAFSDPEAGEIGTVYQATNWHYTGFGKTKHYNIIYHDGRTFMNDRDFNKKYGFKNLSNFMDEHQELRLKTIEPKARYIKLLGNKSENKKMARVLTPRIHPYPKRNAVQDSRENRSDTIGESLGQYQSTALNNTGRKEGVS